MDEPALQFPQIPVAERHRTARARHDDEQRAAATEMAPDQGRAPALTDLAALVLLAVFIVAATAGGFLLRPWAGCFSLAGSSLVAAIILAS